MCIRDREKILTRILRGDSHIHPDDQARVVESLYSIRKGSHYADMELRIRTADDRYLWCRARLTAQISQANHPIHAIGVLIDIDNEKRQAEKLLEIAQHDSLTGLYNKGTSQKRIEEHLKSLDEHSCSALMILDLDNFKQINDSMGPVSYTHLDVYKRQPTSCKTVAKRHPHKRTPCTRPTDRDSGRPILFCTYVRWEETVSYTHLSKTSPQPQVLRFKFPLLRKRKFADDLPGHSDKMAVNPTFLGLLQESPSDFSSINASLPNRSALNQCKIEKYTFQTDKFAFPSQGMILVKICQNQHLVKHYF